MTDAVCSAGRFENERDEELDASCVRKTEEEREDELVSTCVRSETESDDVGREADSSDDCDGSEGDTVLLVEREKESVIEAVSVLVPEQGSNVAVPFRCVMSLNAFRVNGLSHKLQPKSQEELERSTTAARSSSFEERTLNKFKSESKEVALPGKTMLLFSEKLKFADGRIFCVAIEMKDEFPELLRILLMNLKSPDI